VQIKQIFIYLFSKIGIEFIFLFIPLTIIQIFADNFEFNFL